MRSIPGSGSEQGTNYRRIGRYRWCKTVRTKTPRSVFHFFLSVFQPLLTPDLVRCVFGTLHVHAPAPHGNSTHHRENRNHRSEATAGVGRGCARRSQWWCGHHRVPLPVLCTRYRFFFALLLRHRFIRRYSGCSCGACSKDTAGCCCVRGRCSLPVGPLVRGVARVAGLGGEIRMSHRR